MEQKTRLIVVVLAAVAVISLFAAVGLNNAKQALSKEKDNLKRELASITQERDSLISQINIAREDRRKFQERLDSVTKSLDQISRERDDYRQRFEMVSREKEELLDKIQSLVKQPQVTQQAQIPAGTEDAYWANILKEKANLELQVSNLKDELKKMRIKTEEAVRDKTNAELQLSSAKQEKQDLERKLQYNERLVELLSGDLVKETKDRRALEDQIKTLKEENNGIKGQLKELGRTKINLEKKLQSLEEQKTTLERRMEETNTILEQKVGQMIEVKEEVAQVQASAVASAPAKTEPKSVELPPIVVKSQEEMAQAGSSLNAALEGRVIAINKENNFIVVDLGQERGVQVSQRFKIYRQMQPIAAVEVIQVRRAIAACDIREGSVKEIRVGDTVKAF